MPPRPTTTSTLTLTLNRSRMTPKGGMVAMKVQLIVVQGKSEGKTIPLAGPPAGTRGGETILIPAFLEGSAARAGGPIGPADDASDDEYERHPVIDGDTVQDLPTNLTGPVAGKKPKPEAGDKRSNDAAAE